MSTEAHVKEPASTFDETVLDDPRWELLATGEATPEQVSDLRAWAERSEAAKAAWAAFQPATAEKIDRLTDRVLRDLERKELNSAHDTNRHDNSIEGKYRLEATSKVGSPPEPQESTLRGGLVERFWGSLSKAPDAADGYSAAGTGQGQLVLGSIFSGRYKVVRCIAQGGLGAVYEVVHRETERHLALKVMLPHFVHSDDMRERFLREARIAAQVNSAYIVDVLEAGIDETTQLPFLVMELLKGEELGKRLRRVGKFGFEEAVGYLWQVALALDKTHRANIVHCDLKPENLFLCEDEDGPAQIKVLDFGIAKLVLGLGTQANATRAIGSPLYMAPELLTSQRNGSPAADIYSLGMVAYTLLVGTSYWAEEQNANDNVFAFVMAVMNGPQEPPTARAVRRGVTLPEAFDEWFCQATSLRPEQRFLKATVMIAGLANALGVPVPMLPTAHAAGVAESLGVETLTVQSKLTVSSIPAQSTRAPGRQAKKPHRQMGRLAMGYGLVALALAGVGIGISHIVGGGSSTQVARTGVQKAVLGFKQMPLGTGRAVNSKPAPTVGDLPLVEVRVGAPVGMVGAGFVGRDAFAVTQDGTIWQWPSLVDSPVSFRVDAKYVACGTTYKVILHRDGGISLWRGGDDLTKFNSISSVTAVAAGHRHVMAIRNKELWIANLYDSTELPDGWSPEPSIAKTVEFHRISGVVNVIDVVASGKRFIARRADGKVLQLVIVDIGRTPIVPKEVEGLDRVVAVATGDAHSLAIRDDGSLWGWGDNSLAQLGMENALHATPQKKPNHSKNKDSDIIVEVYGTQPGLPRRSSWPDQSQLKNAFYATPQKIRNGIKGVGAAANASIVVDREGKVWITGTNRRSPLASIMTPRQGFPNFRALTGITEGATTGEYSVALRNDGTIYIWGWNVGTERIPLIPPGGASMALDTF